MEKKNLLISSWNIQGHTSKGHDKFTDPEFITNIKNSDIICLMETLSGPEDNLEIPDFKAIHLVRPKSKKSRKRFGGISVYVKSCLKRGIKFLKHQTNDYIWLQLCRSFFGLKKDIFICYMYNPPSDSSYTKSLDLDYFDILEKEISLFSEQGQNILGGDLNARTGIGFDFIKEDNGAHFPLFDGYCPDNKLSQRQSMDKIVTSRGRQLNDLCIQLGLRILNGRIFGDSLGQHTSYQYGGNSVIDYFIVSEQLLEYISFFKVHKFDGLMSDHCKISLMINVNCFLHVVNPKLTGIPNKYKWDDNSETKFKLALESNLVKALIKEFENSISNNFSIEKNKIENIVNNFNKIIYDAADQCLKKKGEP
ncbi:Hypothetical predicted protein [Mytilus galloprovincialis]|uniref:Endonuclease/exonuclease/phosphatase domain-containing protein n=1 Tax=Mytilus galloprovincialis TaxID=29158 RepID=A0A8B6BYM3_MYTGA|nr:Hypothetical predicted protein [Mytilus galloprovincialis]